MSRYTLPLLWIGWLAAASLQAQTSGRLFLFPSSAGQNITVLDAATLAPVGVVAAPPNVSQVAGLPDGSKYYLIANNPTQTITVVNGASLAIVRPISLGANASTAVVTPDGRRLLVSAGTLHVFDTSTDQEIGNVPVGGGPTDIEVSHDSTRAYVLSPASGTVTVVNLTNNQAVTQYSIPGPLSAALLPSGTRLAVLNTTGLNLINPNNGNIVTTVPLSITAGKVVITPDSSRAVVLNRGFTPTVSSVVVDLATGQTRTIGAGNVQLDQVLIADNDTAFGLVSVSNTIARIDLATGNPAIQTYGAGTRVMNISPNGRTLYLASFQNSSVSRVDVPSNAQQGQPQTVGIPPVNAGLVILPASANPVNTTIVGGDRQNVLAGQTTPFALAVKVTTTDGTPVFNIPVTFATGTQGVTFTPTQPSRTNSRGVATAYVTVPPAASTATPGEDGGTAAASTQAASEAGGVNQFSTDQQIITVTATVQGSTGASFTITVTTSTGLSIVSGNNQLSRPQTDYPLPLVVRATGSDGSPLVGATVTFQSQDGYVTPFQQMVQVDGDGLASARIQGGSLPTTLTFVTPTVSARIDAMPEIQPVTFFLSLGYILPSGMEIISGDNQEGNINTTLLLPLCVRIGTSGSLGQFSLIGVYWQVLDGPAGTASATPNPAITITDANGLTCTSVTLGPRAGPQDIRIRAYVPTVPGFVPAEGVVFRAHAKGGPPARVVIFQGNNQEGRPGQTLPVALGVQVFDSGGNPVPLGPGFAYPVRYTFNQPNAGSISNDFQQSDGKATALVTIALNYVGPFSVIATSGDGRAEFTFRSVSQPSAIVRVSGQDQSVSIGGTTAQPLIARVNDAQGAAVPGVQVTFSGPSSVTFVPSSGAGGNPVQVVTGSDGRASVNVRVNAGAPAGSLTITASASVGSVTFNLNVLGRTPSFTAASIVNAASFVVGIVPGGLATLFGTGLSEVTGLELPGGATTHKGVQVRVGGQPAPLFLVGRTESGQEQINFQVRTDIPGGPSATVTVEVSNNGATFSVPNVPVLRAQPGVFEYTPSGSTVKYAAAVKPDGSVIGPNNRVARGAAFSIFLTGLGPTLPLLATGQAAPSNPPATTFFQPTVGVGGRGVRVLFSGLTPGFVGLYQINVELDNDTPTGDAVTLDVIVEGASSQTSRIAVQ